METQKYMRKPFLIDAVEITEENFEEVAAWCGGDIRTARVDGEDKRYIKVRVSRPLNDRQTQGFLGDRVLFANKGFKVYTPQAFADNFEQVFQEATP